jgi:hypothetical protein
VTKVYGQSGALQGKYDFDGSGENARGSLEAATPMNGPVLADGRDGASNSAYLLDGTNDYLQINDAADLASFGGNDFTVSIWVKKLSASSGSDNIAVVTKWNNGGTQGSNEWLLGMGNNANQPQPVFVIESGTTKYQAIGATSLALNQWYHLLAKREAGTIKLYVNGQLDGSVNVGTAVVNTTSLPLYIGRYQSGYYSHCVVDELQIFNKALTDDEIGKLNEGKPGELLVSNIYDDRGFRLAKKNHMTNKTTWYIRDASSKFTYITSSLSAV